MANESRGLSARATERVLAGETSGAVNRCRFRAHRVRLDDTLIQGERTFPVDSLGVVRRFLGAERLPVGLPAAHRRLRRGEARGLGLHELDAITAASTVTR